MARTVPGILMDEGDPRVKKLQEAAWRLNSLCSKPGNRIPEDYKRKIGRVSSRASALCENAAYMEMDDFVARAAIMKKEIEEKEQEIKDVEEAALNSIKGNCLVATGAGAYEIGKRSTPAEKVAHPGPGEPAAWTESAGTTDRGAGAGALTSAEVAARCAEDPEALYLCGIGLRDGDMDALCAGLGRAGSELTVLDLSHNAIADAGVQRLATGFARGLCPHLRELWVCGNPFSTLGSQMLSGGLCAMRRGLVVHLGQGRQGAEQGTTVARAEQLQAGAEEALVSAPTDLAAERDSGAASAAGDTSPAAVAEQPGSAAGTAGTLLAEAPPAEESPNAAEGTPGLVVELLNRAGDVCGQGASSAALSARAVVSLPEDVASVGELDLEVSPTRFVIRRRCDDAVIADNAWPWPVDADTTHAKFSRRRRTLTLTTAFALRA